MTEAMTATKVQAQFKAGIQHITKWRKEMSMKTIQEKLDKLKAQDRDLRKKVDLAYTEASGKLEDDMEELEAAAIYSISTIVLKVEEVTGRKFKASINQAGISIDGAFVAEKGPEIKLPNPLSYKGQLANYVRNVAKLIRNNWGFKDPCEFIEWAQPHFDKGWNQK